MDTPDETPKPKIDKRKLTITKCEGCGKDIAFVPYGESAPRGMREAKEIWVGTEEVYVCGADTYEGYITACKRKAREKLARCPGCNTDKIDPGEICDSCTRLLEIGRKARAEDPLVNWVGRPFQLFHENFREIATHNPEDEKARERLMLLLAQAVAGRGADFDANPDRPYEVRAEVTRPQKEALDKLVQALADALDAARRAGHKQGRALLMGLASGGLSLDQLDRATMKVEDKSEKD